MVRSAKEKLINILEALKDRIASPSDVIASTGLPRYEVLAAFHVLEALGLIEIVYSRGNYKLYRLTVSGEHVLKALREGREIVVVPNDGTNATEPSKVIETPAPSSNEIAMASAET